MAIKLSDLTKQTRVIQVDVGASEPLEIEYRVQAYTPEIEAEIAGAEQRPAGTLAHILSKLVVRWSLIDDNGEMYPLDNDHVMRLPLSFMLTIFTKIAEDMRPNLPNAGD
ncbi:MAG: hypothetical protein ABWK53_10470 [Anaerolineales bacterium]